MIFENTKKDHTKLICDIGEVSSLFAQSRNLSSFLKNITRLVSNHMCSEVCSIYLYYSDTKELHLKATTGLNEELVDNVILKYGEGLTGLAMKELRPVREERASRSPGFKYIKGLGEEEFESFMAVPIHRGHSVIGVMVVQNKKSDFFTEQDGDILIGITQQIANIIEMTRMILALEEEHQLSDENSLHVAPPKFIKGKVGAIGFAYSDVFFHKSRRRWDDCSWSLDGKYTAQDFDRAVEKTIEQLEQYQTILEEKILDASALIFTAQILMLKDEAFLDLIKQKAESGMHYITATIQVVENYISRLRHLSNSYLKEKIYDLMDVGQRLISNLVDESFEEHGINGKIVVSRELYPSDILKLSSQKVSGLILLSGGVTSHLSILARSLGIPLIISQESSLLNLSSDHKILMDANQGTIYVDPEDDVVEKFFEQQRVQQEAKSLGSIESETFTSDETKISILANINLINDLEVANELKLEGVGLYRSEFPFMIRSDFPSEEEQLVIYRKLFDHMKDKEVTFRTLDIGGDKALSYFEEHAKEQNPFLGMRSIRFSLKHRQIFQQQIRAVLRAGAQHSNVRLMFPMISSVDEFLEAKKVVEECQVQLEKENKNFCQSLKVGMMIEIPSVVEVLDDLTEVADFFSLGTNDFIQYFLAVDRTNEKVSDLYLPHHPSILRSLKKITDKIIQAKKDLSICGDMVHDPKYIPFLLGIGIRKISINPQYMLKIQPFIQNLNMTECCEFSDKVLKISRLDEIEKLFH